MVDAGVLHKLVTALLGGSGKFYFTKRNEYVLFLQGKKYTKDPGIFGH